MLFPQIDAQIAKATARFKEEITKERIEAELEREIQKESGLSDREITHQSISKLEKELSG